MSWLEVLPHFNGWQVKVRGAVRAMSIHKTLEAAIRIARRRAQREHRGLVVLYDTFGSSLRATP